MLFFILHIIRSKIPITRFGIEPMELNLSLNLRWSKKEGTITKTAYVLLDHMIELPLILILRKILKTEDYDMHMLFFYIWHSIYA
jgi:hypothetical protein